MSRELREKLERLAKKIDDMGRFLDVAHKKDIVKELEQKTAADGFWNDTLAARKVMQELDAAKEAIQTWNELQQTHQDLNAHLDLAEEANDLEEEKDVAKGAEALASKLQGLELRALLSGPHDKSNAILSLHAGAGGTEACDWVEMLLRLYMRWVEKKGFEFEVTDLLEGDGAGFRNVTAMVRGPYAYGLLQAEIGVHRLVRISPFDANARRHTSFASCDIIPEVEDEINIEIKESDLRVDTYRSSGAGGQYVNKTESAVRLTHIPTGVVVACQKERSQLKNRALALKILKARLYDLEMEKQRAALEKHYDEKGQIAWGNQIRSYVFMPYQLVKDLRTNVETGNVQAVMDGEIDAFIKAYLDWKTTKKDASIRP
ncbi:MAG: peptide chain release factor 2 [Elusimicrobia bacterium]|nr:peptide chain release factor 2 [Candidatus Obscuribacterium magneticum]